MGAVLQTLTQTQSPAIRRWPGFYFPADEPYLHFAFIAAHAIGQGAVIWVFISEIFPNRQRAGGQTLGSFTHWIFAALLTTFFPKMVSAFAPGQVFWFFCGMMVLQLVWIKLMVPETKGVPLEDMQRKLGIR